MNPTRVFVIASSPVVRAGLRSMLMDAATVTSVEVVGDGEPGDSEAEISLSGAEIVLVSEGSLTEEADFAASAAFPGATSADPLALVLVSDDEGAISRLGAMGLDAWGVVSPEATSEELAAAIVAVARGFVVLPAVLSQRIFEGIPTTEELPKPLTAREAEVLELLSRGLANKALARRLAISEHTVKFHVSSIYAKLEVRSRAEAVSRGARLGLIKL